MELVRDFEREQKTIKTIMEYIKEEETFFLIGFKVFFKFVLCLMEKEDGTRFICYADYVLKNTYINKLLELEKKNKFLENVENINIFGFNYEINYMITIKKIKNEISKANHLYSRCEYVYNKIIYKEQEKTKNKITLKNNCLKIKDCVKLESLKEDYIYYIKSINTVKYGNITKYIMDLLDNENKNINDVISSPFLEDNLKNININDLINKEFLQLKTIKIKTHVLKKNKFMDCITNLNNIENKEQKEILNKINNELKENKEVAEEEKKKILYS